MNASPQHRIHERLHSAEQEHGVRILYACESGSRAWGFASADSDYDVRFVYVRPRDWYLSVNVENRRDVIEYPIVDDLDINGWDIRKALTLFRKSNPPLLEWLASPIIYREHHPLVDELRQMASVYHSPVAMAYHYLSMARNNHREFLQGESVILQKYLYVLRPLLAIRWIESQSSPPPVEFAKLVDATVQDESLLAAIEDLLVKKRAGLEKDRSPRIAPLSDYIAAELARLEELHMDGAEKPDVELLNDYFRRVLTGKW